MEPTIGGQKRISRELVLSLTSAREAGIVAALMFDPGPDRDDALDQEKRVVQRISDAGLTLSGPNKSPRVGTESADTATAQVANMLQRGFGAKKPPTDLYKAYSATTHGTLYGLMNFMTPLPEPDGSIRLHWGPDANVLDSTVQTAIVAFREAWVRVNTVTGWANGHTAGDWADDLNAIFNP
jgi:hypothetical protein